MGLTSTFYSGLSGMNANSMQFEVIGNNVANVNTTGFKSKRVLFQTHFARTLNMGSVATDSFGGTNPMQLGQGARIAEIDTDFTMGSVEVTNVNSDVAIEGNGFFVMRDANGERTFSRNGAFSVNNRGRLVSSDGRMVQGFMADNDFNIVEGTLTNLEVPIGFLTVARATDSAVIQGNLNADGVAGTQGGALTSNALVDGAGNPVTGAIALSDVRDATNPGVAVFSVGDTITVEGKKGTRKLPEASFTIAAGQTLNDLAAFMEDALGINTSATVPGSPGVTISGGQLRIETNYGELNDITMPNDAVRVNGSSTPLNWSHPTLATGESVNTSFTAYDSLGTEMMVDVTFVCEEKALNGSTWRFYATSGDDTDADLVLGTGTVSFDTLGNYVSSDHVSITMDRNMTGAESPQAIDLDLSRLTTLSEDSGSEIALSSQDGVPIGTLSDFSVGTDGIITGTFTNGLTRSLGQIALSTFSNPKGLVDVGDSTYIEGPNSGVPVISAPQEMAAGSLQSGALELSNVDLSEQFVDLITASTGFSANSRVISTADEMMREILTIVR